MSDDAELLNTVVRFAAPMLADPAITAEQGIKIAAAFMVVAEQIFRVIGGPELAAQQFYAAADACVSAISPTG